MPMFILSLAGPTKASAGQGRSQAQQAAKELAKKVGVQITDIYLSPATAISSLSSIRPTGGAAKFALALGSLGNVRNRPPSMARG